MKLVVRIMHFQLKSLNYYRLKFYATQICLNLKNFVSFLKLVMKEHLEIIFLQVKYTQLDKCCRKYTPLSISIV
jgi:hypothetical protein